MSTQLNQNQFQQLPIQGQLDLAVGGASSTLAARIQVGNTLIPGQAVKIVDSASEIPLVQALAADTDDIYGFIEYDIKNQSLVEGRIANVSRGRLNIMYMIASEAISPYARVMVVVSSKKVANATSGKRIAGYALDKASADGDLIRVQIDLPGALA